MLIEHKYVLAVCIQPSYNDKNPPASFFNPHKLEAVSHSYKALSDIFLKMYLFTYSYSVTTYLHYVMYFCFVHFKTSSVNQPISK